MEKVTDIRSHPKFRPKLDPDDPNYERDQYLEDLDAGLLPPPIPIPDHFLMEDTTIPNHSLMEEVDAADVLADLEEGPVEKVGVPTLATGLSICSECKYKIDFRPRWKRLLRPGVKLWGLQCAQHPLKKCLNPITGEKGYLPEGIEVPAYATGSEQGFCNCLTLNPTGTCRLFKPKITYR